MGVSNIYISGEYDIDGTVDWAIANCASFEKYRIVELDWEEKMLRECWFRLEIHFNDAADQTLFELKFL